MDYTNGRSKLRQCLGVTRKVRRVNDIAIANCNLLTIFNQPWSNPGHNLKLLNFNTVQHVLNSRETQSKGNSSVLAHNINRSRQYFQYIQREYQTRHLQPNNGSARFTSCQSTLNIVCLGKLNLTKSISQWARVLVLELSTTRCQDPDSDIFLQQWQSSVTSHRRK